MISVIVYGRNDSHGYNLHKRATISLNCIAEVLSHPGDEIIFVDCNTPDDMPTFPEAIHDMLTDKAKELLRILRIPPAIFNKYKNDTYLKVLEPLARNVAIRRSNPENRWILSTNTDMVFIPRIAERSLSDVVSQIPDGFYELPRFEAPESLWESVDRKAPQEIMKSFLRWGTTLHLNEVVIAEAYDRYDGPGDFQLALRRQMFSIQGFDERIVLGWHVDTNLCKRMYILNGSTDSLVDHFLAYHCDHNRRTTERHGPGRKEDDPFQFIFNVTDPCLPHQAQTWGLPDESIEEIRLLEKCDCRYARVLESLLPGLAVPMTEDMLKADAYNHGLLFDLHHVLPYIVDHLTTLSPSVDVAYVGCNSEILKLVGKFRSRFGHAGRTLYNKRLLNLQAGGLRGISLPNRCEESGFRYMFEKSSIFIFDFGMAGFPKETNSVGVEVPASKMMMEYAGLLFQILHTCALRERESIDRGSSPRKFIVLGIQNTLFEWPVSHLLGITHTAYGTHVRHGFVRRDVAEKLIYYPRNKTLARNAAEAFKDQWRRLYVSICLTIHLAGSNALPGVIKTVFRDVAGFTLSFFSRDRSSRV